MTIFNSAQIFCTKPIPPEAIDRIVELDSELVLVSSQSNGLIDSIEYSDLICRDMDLLLNSIVAILKEYNVEPEPNSTSLYFGDVDGGFVYRDGRFVGIEIDDYYILNAAPNTLAEVLRSQGWTVIPPAETEVDASC